VYDPKTENKDTENRNVKWVLVGTNCSFSSLLTLTSKFGKGIKFAKWFLSLFIDAIIYTPTLPTPS